VVKPLGETRPGWKVLRVLGNLLALEGFEQDRLRGRARRGAGRQAGSVAERLNNQAEGIVVSSATGCAWALQRIADVPIHFADPLARRAPSLQKTRDAMPPAARMAPATLAALGLAGWRPGARGTVSAATANSSPRQLDDGVQTAACASPPAHPSTAALGAMQR
jgi:NADH-quinone oxidoreductase subunit G